MRTIRPTFDDLEGRRRLSVVLPESSIAAPAIITFRDQITNTYMPYIAWTGTDDHLNIEYLVSGVKTTLPETSFAAPAPAVFQGRPFIAWTGTDAQHHLNVESSADGMTFDYKTVLDAPARDQGVLNGLDATTFDTDGPVLGPNVAALCIAWTGTDNRINYAYAFGPFGQYFGPANMLLEYSDFSPSLTTFNGDFIVAWTDLYRGNETSAYSITYQTLAGDVDYVMASNNGPSLTTDDDYPGASSLGMAWTDAATQVVSVLTPEFGDQAIFLGTSPYAPSLAVDYIPDDNHFYIAREGLDGQIHYDTS
jgi:hypothetical protein